MTKRAPRVMMLSWEYPPRIVGGIARHVHELSLALAARGVQVEVVTAPHPGTPAREALRVPKRAGSAGGRLVVHRAGADSVVPIDFLNGIHQLNGSLAETAIQVLREDRIDLIHAHDWLVAPAGKLLKNAYHIPLVATIHATEHGRNHGIHNDLQHYIHSWEWLLSYEAWRVIVCSKYMAGELHEVLATPEDKLDVIHNGLDLRRLVRKTKVSDDFRHRFAAPDDRIVLFVGRMVREKGAHVLVEALPAVLREHPKARLVLVGGGPNDHLRRRALALGVMDRVLLTGFVSEEDLQGLYQVAEVAVYPSLYEPFGIVALEGMGTGVPVVTSDIGGLREVVEHGVSGLLTWANNAASLAWGINQVLDDPELAAKLAREGQRRVKEHFGWDRIAGQTVEVYQRVIAEARRSGWTKRGERQ